MTTITIRELTTSAEMATAVDLQKNYWGEDMGALVPAHMLMSLATHGGHIPAAFDGDKMIGLLIGFVGADLSDSDDTRPIAKRLLVMSKRMVVLPDYRSHNIGTLLKLAQRDFAIRYGIELVTWTFDPLLARNAYLNLYKLGAIGQRYAVNYFGADTAYQMLSDDRLVVNWWVSHPHTQPHVDGTAPKFSIQELLASGVCLLNPAQRNPAGLLTPPATLTTPFGDILLLEIPMDFVALQQEDNALGRAWRDHVREAFQLAFGAGYVVTSFAREDERTCYVFTRDDGTYTFTK
jgi:chorismate synthase